MLAFSSSLPQAYLLQCHHCWQCVPTNPVSFANPFDSLHSADADYMASKFAPHIPQIMVNMPHL
jgi:hypothetical protein